MSIIAFALVVSLIFPIAPIAPSGDFVSPEYCTEHEVAKATDGFCSTKSVTEEPMSIDGWDFYQDGRSCPTGKSLPDYGEIGEPIYMDQDGNLRTPTRILPDKNGKIYVIDVQGVLDGAFELVTTRDGFKALFQVDNPAIGAAFCVDDTGIIHLGTGSVEIVVLN